MRYYQFLIVVLILAYCKAPTAMQQVSEHSEDLSVHRPVYSVQDEPSSDNKPTVQLPLTNYITAEIDSINKLVVLENQQKKWDGYTVQIYRGNSRKEAQDALTSVKKTFPDLDSEMRYYQPTYRVRSGVFFDRLEATRAYNSLKLMFPRAILLPEKLELGK